MKILTITAMIGLGLILIGLVLELTGRRTSYENAIDKYNTWILHGKDVATKVVTIEGHKYIIMDGYKCGSIIHAESCSCKK